MRAVLQRVNRAAVRVDGETVGEITRPGLLALVGATHDDGPEQVATIARKIAELRIFDGPGDDGGAPGREASASDLGAPVLVVSQFTLYADVRKGRWPPRSSTPSSGPCAGAGSRWRRGVSAPTCSSTWRPTGPSPSWWRLEARAPRGVGASAGEVRNAGERIRARSAAPAAPPARPGHSRRCEKVAGAYL